MPRPKNKKISMKAYKKMYSSVKKIRKDGFKFDARGNFTGHEKSQITKAFKQIKFLQSARGDFVRVPRLKNETDRQYTRRLNKLKYETGTPAWSKNGVFVKKNKNQRFEFKKGRVVIINKKLKTKTTFHILTFEEQTAMVDVPTAYYKEIKESLLSPLNYPKAELMSYKVEYFGNTVIVTDSLEFALEDISQKLNYYVEPDSITIYATKNATKKRELKNAARTKIKNYRRYRRRN